MFFAGICPQSVHAITIEEVNLLLSDLSDDLLTEIPLLSATGLSWSDPYVGQVLGYPNHYGFGLTLGVPLLPSKHWETIGDDVFASSFPNVNKEKIAFPGYTLEGRVGGFAEIPFDIGIKIGLIPTLPLFGDLDYYSFQYGADIRYRIIRHAISKAEVSIGLGYNRVEAKITGDYQYTITPGFTSNGGTLTFGWESDMINFKLYALQPVLGTALGLFASLDLGYEFLNTFWDVTANANGILDGNINAGNSHGGSVSHVVNDYYTVTMERSGLSFVIQTGVSFEFKKGMVLDVSLLTSVFNFSFMPVLNIRFQQ
jgi:hypothetical protein